MVIYESGGEIIKIENLAATLQLCIESVVKKVLFPVVTMMALTTKSSSLMTPLRLRIYSNPAEAVFRLLGMNNKI